MSSRKNFLVVISSPSGAGKTTLVATLLERVPETRLSVSHTTRPPRPTEAEGKEYYFVSREEFKNKIERGEFLEWAEIHGHLYGTSRQMIQDILAAGCDAILDIDVQGAEQVRRVFPDAVTIFVLPPSLSVLKQRLISRGTETGEMVEQRLRVARQEILRYIEFEYVLINNDLGAAGIAVEAIVRAERQRLNRQEQDALAVLGTFQDG